MTYSKLVAAIKKIKKTNRGTNLAILAFEWQKQTVAAYISYLYIQCF